MFTRASPHHSVLVSPCTFPDPEILHCILRRNPEDRLVSFPYENVA